MSLKAFSVYDLKGLCHGSPFFMSSNGAAIRAFSDLANDPQSTLYRHPSDFQLFQIGTFDDVTGRMVSLDRAVLLGLASDFKTERVSPAANLVNEALNRPLATTAELNGDPK